MNKILSKMRLKTKISSYHKLFIFAKQVVQFLIRKHKNLMLFSFNLLNIAIKIIIADFFRTHRSISQICFYTLFYYIIVSDFIIISATVPKRLVLKAKIPSRNSKTFSSPTMVIIITPKINNLIILSVKFYYSSTTSPSTRCNSRSHKAFLHLMS